MHKYDNGDGYVGNENVIYLINVVCTDGGSWLNTISSNWKLCEISESVAHYSDARCTLSKVEGDKPNKVSRPKLFTELVRN